MQNASIHHDDIGRRGNSPSPRIRGSDAEPGAVVRRLWVVEMLQQYITCCPILPQNAEKIAIFVPDIILGGIYTMNKASRRSRLDIKFERISADVVAIVLTILVAGSTIRILLLRAFSTPVLGTMAAGFFAEAFALWNARRLWRQSHIAIAK